MFEYLHRQTPPVVHRDLKPSNIIVGVDGRYRVVDFGAVAERLRPEGSSTVVGTFGYMAPEQFQGRASVASDIYSSGATAMALLTGSEPEELPHVGLAIDVERALGASVSAPLRQMLVQMLEPNPDRRPVDLARLLAETSRSAAQELAQYPSSNTPAAVPWFQDFFAGPKTRISSLVVLAVVFMLALGEHPRALGIAMFIILPLLTSRLFRRRRHAKQLAPVRRHGELPRDER